MSDAAGRLVLVVAAIGVAAVLSTSPAFAQCDSNYYWDAGYGSWFSADNWYHEVWDSQLEECVDDDTVPGGSDPVLIWSGNPYIAAGGASCDWLGLHSQLDILSGGSLYADQQDIDGWVVQAGGSNTVGTLMMIAPDGGAAGYELSGTGNLSAYRTTVGQSGSGYFYQTGDSTNTVAASFHLGQLPAASGWYELMDTAQLQAHWVRVGREGSGTFVQTGGTFTVTGSLHLGQLPGGDGSYQLANGVLLVEPRAIIGVEGSGTFSQTGGIHTVNEGLTLGQSPGSSGTFSQTGGIHTVNEGLTLGNSAGSNGSYELSGDGELSAQSVTVGKLGTGTFTQASGSSSTLEYLGLGTEPGSEGSYELSGDAELSTQWAGIGRLGDGQMSQTGGTASYEGGMSVGGLWEGPPGGSGQYLLEGGELLPFWIKIAIGVDSVGTFIQTGGTNTVSDVLTLGTSAGSHGTYDLGGSGTLSAHWESVGIAGSGVFVQSGGTNTVTETLILGKNAGSDGTYELNAGVLSVNGNVTIGREGVGVFKQGNGTFTVGDIASGIGLGAMSGSEGQLELSGGTLSVSSWMAVGQGGTGALVVSGSSASLDVPCLEVGRQTGTGTFDIQDSGASISARTLVLGAHCSFSAVPGASVRVTTGGGSFQNYSTDEAALAGLHDLNLICDGDPIYMEVAGYDGGPYSPYCDEGNFTIDTLTVNGVLHLVDDLDNGNRGGTHGWHEALYIDNLTTETSGIIYTHGLHIYIDCDDPFAYPWICSGTGCGDFDHDCDADAADFVEFISCLSGPDVPIGAECNPGDCDADGDIDVTDLAEFQVAYMGE